MSQTEFIDDLSYWVEGDRKTALRALELVEAVLRDPFSGIGGPEPLKYLAESLIERRGFDPADQMRRYLRSYPEFPKPEHRAIGPAGGEQSIR